MNPKDTGFFQQNLEKIILAIALLFLLLFAWWFLLGNPFTVQAGGRTLTADQIEQFVDQKVQSLDSRISSNESVLPDRSSPKYSKAFKEDLVEPTTTLASLAPLAEPGLDSSWDDVIEDGPYYNLPRPPVAQEILTRKGHAVLSDDLPTRQLEGLIKLVGNHEPRDFTYVSVAATFDMDDWVRRLQSGDKDTRVPQRWWNGMLGVAGVFLQRQELDESTGQWVNTVMVDKLPGQLAFKPDAAVELTSLQAKKAIQLVRASQERIARPEFPKTSGNILWSPPNADAQELDADGQRKLARYNTKINNLKEQIKRLQEQAIKAREAPQRSERQQPRGRRQSPGRGAVDPGGYGAPDGGGRAPRARPSRGSRDNARQDAPQTPQERINLLQQQLIDTKVQRNELLGIESDVLSTQGYGGYEGQGGLDDYSGGFGGPGGYGAPDSYGKPSAFGGRGDYGGGFDPYAGRPGAYGGGVDAYAVGPGSEAEAEPESRKIKVWAHDLSIEPGKTYRYRLVVSVLNPLYRQKRIDDTLREENYNKLALGPDPAELDASSWSAPVRVDSEHYFFMVKGSAQSQTARVEVWEVYDGRWVFEEFEVRPGDPIGRVVEKKLHSGVQQKLDMNVGMVVVDLVPTAGSGFRAAGVRMLYLDPQSNRIADRTVEDDRNNPDRIRLQNELALESELALSDPAPGIQPAY
jgi:hypothetical protein